MPLKDLRPIVVPKFDELGVNKVAELMKDNEAFMSYFPTNLPKGRTANREYFWNILNTLDEPYVAHLIQHANKARYSATTVESKAEAI